MNGLLSAVLFLSSVNLCVLGPQKPYCKRTNTKCPVATPDLGGAGRMGGQLKVCGTQTTHRTQKPSLVNINMVLKLTSNPQKQDLNL